MLNIYRSLSPKERTLVWVAMIAVVVLSAVAIVGNAGIVAGAQVAAAIGTFALAALAFAQVRELREARIAQERPQVIVDADYSHPPFVFVVLRNIGKGAARDISFEFSAPMEAPEGQNNPLWVPLNQQGYFDRGMNFLAPGAELRNFWGPMPTLAPFLRNQGLQDGITVTTRYRSLIGENGETTVTLNPLLIADRLSTPQPGMKELIEEIEKLADGFNSVVSNNNQEIQVSTAAERQQRQRQHQGQDEGEGS